MLQAWRKNLPAPLVALSYAVAPGNRNLAPQLVFSAF
jgi:hypothetical protein